MEQNVNKIAWREAATGGLYLGLAYTALSYAGYFLQSQGIGAWVNGLTFFTIAGFLYAYARRMGAYHGANGFSYGQSLLFVLRMSLFAGILAGIGQFVLVHWIDPEGFQQKMDLVVATMVENGLVAEEQAEQAGALSVKLMHNPLFSALGGIFNMIVYGGLLGVIVSFFTKRPADPFGGNAGNAGNARPL